MVLEHLQCAPNASLPLIRQNSPQPLKYCFEILQRNDEKKQKQNKQKKQKKNYRGTMKFNLNCHLEEAPGVQGVRWDAIVYVREQIYSR